MSTSRRSKISANTQPTRAQKFWSGVHYQEGEPVFADDSEDTRIRVELWARRIKATDARVDILKILSKEKRPLSVSDIADKLGRPLGDKTLYRALEKLSIPETGFVDRIGSVGGKIHYEISAGKRSHQHIVCPKCGSIECVKI